MLLEWVDVDLSSVSVMGSRHRFGLEASVKPGNSVVPFLCACIKLNSFIIHETIKYQVQSTYRKVGQISLLLPRVWQNAGHRGIFVPSILPADTQYLSRQVSSPWCGESFFLCCSAL